jgi:hypothetical protein
MKQQSQVLSLIALLVVATAVWLWNSRQNPATAGASSIVGYAPINVDNPAIRWWKLDRVRKTDYRSGGRNPFSAIAPPPPAPKALRPGQTGYVPPPPPPPPPDPTLPPNVKFFGYGTIPNGTARRAFLTDGDEVYIVSEGDILLGRFRIVKIGNATIEFEETSSGRQGRAALEDAGPNT